VADGTDPADPDTDGDGVPDDQDDAPTLWIDEDEDGLPDDWESHYGVTDPLADDDGDGLANILEYTEGTSPANPFGLDEGSHFDLSPLYGGSRVNSMADLYAPLRSEDGSLEWAKPVFQVDPTTPARYWRLIDLKTWSASGWSHDADGNPVSRMDGLPGWLGNFPSEVYSIQFSGGWSGPIPAPLYSTAVTGLPRDVTLSTHDDGTFAVTTGQITGYSITSLRVKGGRLGPDLNASDLDGEYAWLPPGEEDLPSELSPWMEGTSWERVKAARYWLWDRVEFSVDQRYWPLNSPMDLVTEGRGTSLDFASAFTVLCRMMDVPARVVVGFAPGTIEAGHRLVRVGDLHVWAEVYVTGHWIPVETTLAKEGTGLGLYVAGEDPTVVGGWVQWYDDPEFGKLPHGWGAEGGALTTGSPEVPVPNPARDTDGDSIPDGVDDDDDGDGIPDIEEMELGTNPVDADSDHDGLDDAAEVLNGTSPRNADTDGDGIADGIEVHILGTNPLDRDTDGAGSCDIQELKHRTDPLDGKDDELALDWDCDGLLDSEEESLGTNPSRWDTDLDGISDPDELDLGTDPLDEDTDDDGVPDGEEGNQGTDPLSGDTDEDGLTDGEETGWVPDYRYVPSDPNMPDTDGDGLTDGLESSIGTRPDRADHDGDGLTDGEERWERLSPLEQDTDGDGVDDFEELKRRDMEDRVDTARDGALPIFLALFILSAAMAFRYRPFDRRIVPDVIESLSELEKWLASLREAPDDEVRRAIYKAYERLCEVLSEYGFLRRKAWTVREFETAVRDALPWVPDELLDELTTLFEEARYSDHELSSDYIDRARKCLSGLREALEEVLETPPEEVPAET
jgi:hypothetical protein